MRPCISRRLSLRKSPTLAWFTQPAGAPSTIMHPCGWPGAVKRSAEASSMASMAARAVGASCSARRPAPPSVSRYSSTASRNRLSFEPKAP